MREPDNDRQELSVRPGTQSMGLEVPFIEGPERCRHLGHELNDIVEMSNGLLVAYCVRCSDRFEAPWFRGGTAVALARAMAAEARSLQRPAVSVREDLNHVLGLLHEDHDAVSVAITDVAKALVETQMKLNEQS